MYGDRYTKCTNVTAEQMKENSSSTLEDAVLYDSVMKVLYNGYPNNGSSIQQKYQLTDDQFREITQLVIWKFTDSYTGYSFSSDNLENVYNELRNVSQLTYPSNFKLNLYLSTNPYVQNFLAAKMLPENQTEYTSVSVNKVWDDANNQDGQRSSEVTVQLLANGSAITYAVTEDSVDNYTVTINGYDITNNYTPGKTSLTVTKVWDDSDDQDGFVLILLMSNYMLMAKNLVMS